MSEQKGTLKYFKMATDSDGITVVTFDRPPVNAMSFDVYPELKVLADIVESSNEIRVVVITAPPDARAWCGGADLNDLCRSASSPASSATGWSRTACRGSTT
jgi:enoyl-CoA hydratase/carnithine racemase